MTITAPWALLLLVPWCIAAYLLASRAGTTQPVPFVTLWKPTSSLGPRPAGRALPAFWLVVLLASTLILIAAASGPGLRGTIKPPAKSSETHAPAPVSPPPLAYTQLLNETDTPWPVRRLSMLLNLQPSPAARTVTIGTAPPADLLVPTPNSQSLALPSSTDLILTDHPAARAIDFTRLPPGTMIVPPPSGFQPMVSLAGTPLLSSSPDHRQIHLGLHGDAFEQSADFVVLFLECVRSLSSTTESTAPIHMAAATPAPNLNPSSLKAPPVRQLSAQFSVVGLGGTLLASLLYLRQCRRPASSGFRTNQPS